MKNLAIAAASFLLLLPLLVHHSHRHAQAKQLPPAFGTELVPERSTQESSDPSQSEIIEEEREPKRQRATNPRRNRGRKLKIQLDGDEDGGGVDSGDDAGEF